MSLELLGTSGCHLCELAEAIVDEVFAGTGKTIPLTLIEIADDPDLMDAFGIRIPVLRYQDQVLGWPFTAAEVTDFISAINAEPHHPLTPEHQP